MDRERVRCELAVETLRMGGGLRLRAQGTSMIPAIWPGDVLSVQEVAASAIRVGDVTLCRCDGRLVAHRVVRVEGVGDNFAVICRGDFVGCEDVPTDSQHLLGRVQQVVRNGRTVAFGPLGFLGRGFGWILRHSFWTRTLALRMQHWRGRSRETLQVPIPAIRGKS